jgi:hypothetical protein
MESSREISTVLLTRMLEVGCIELSKKQMRFRIFSENTAEETAYFCISEVQKNTKKCGEAPRKTLLLLLSFTQK